MNFLDALLILIILIGIFVITGITAGVILDEVQHYRQRKQWFTLNACVTCYYDASEGHIDAIPGCDRCEPCDHPDCAGSRVCDCGWYGEGHGFSWVPCEWCHDEHAGNRYPIMTEGKNL